MCYHHCMNPTILKEIGLTPSQSKAYITLIEQGEQTPPALAKVINESRSNTYMILARLHELGLCEKVEHDGQLLYRASNPMALESLAEQKRKNIMQLEASVKHAMPTLLSYYYSFTERPGIRQLQGVEGFKEVYRDILRTKKPVLLVRTPAEVKNLGQDFMQHYIGKRIELGIEVEALTPDIPEANHDPEIDKKTLFKRHWMPADTYTAPVKIAIYGNKVTFVAFGSEPMAVMIDNPLIADAMRQMFALAREPLL